MNLSYIIDLSGIFKEEGFRVPHVEGIRRYSIKPKELSAQKIVEMRDAVRRGVNGEVEKHMFFIIMDNDRAVLDPLSKCLNAIQQDDITFGKDDLELHIVCSFIKQAEGFVLQDYENSLPSMNRVQVYSWLMDKYDYNGDKPIDDKRRAHAIVRLVDMLCKHNQEIGVTLKAVARKDRDKDIQHIHNLFGNACVCFEQEVRDGAVGHYYCYKNLQHLLNIPEGALDNYIKDNVFPYRNDKKELDKRIDNTSEWFLKSQRVPIEASVITEKTQGLLLKSSDIDKEFLVNAADNNLVFIDELAKTGGWQLEGMEQFLSECQNQVEFGKVSQETVSEEFVRKLYNKLVTHERVGFDRINNEVSEIRRKHVNKYKQFIDNDLYGFLNQQQSGNYVSLQEVLTPDETRKHGSNIDYGIAFIEYLEAGKGDYLVDYEVSMGDTHFTRIKEALEQEENDKKRDYQKQATEIDEKYQSEGEDQPSAIKRTFGKVDERIKACWEEKQRCDFQLDHWVDEDAGRKLTARTRSVIAFGTGIAAALIWLFVSFRFLADGAKDMFGHYGRFQWGLFSTFVLAGFVVAVAFLLKALRNRKDAEEALGIARQAKKILMGECVEEMKSLIQKHYDHLLSYHGLKTMNELKEFVAWKKEDLVSFRKAIFKLMLLHRLSVSDAETINVYDDEGNTIELVDEMDAKTILFGAEGNKRQVPYAFAGQYIVLSETFNEFKRKKARLETSRSSLSHTSLNFDQAVIEKEVIACMKEHEGIGITYSALKDASVLPQTEGVEMDDIRQGQCGDCYFMATLAAIAKMSPEYIIGKNGMVEELDGEHRFFRVKFYDKDGQRVNVDIDNRFWNSNDEPWYAKVGKSNGQEIGTYDPWVMAVEKAWAKANNDGYDGIEGARGDGKEYVRRVEYSFAVTGKPAFYCKTKSVTDRKKLLEMMKKHFREDRLPITLYSASEEDSAFSSTDDRLVHNHAYALQSVNDDDTFDIFNPWNSHNSNENVKGKHYEKVTIDFIKDNFDVVVFFGIKEADFDSFERDLTDNAGENEVTKGMETILMAEFRRLALQMHKFGDLLTEENMKKTLVNASFLFSKNKIVDTNGIGKSCQLMFLEGGKSGICDEADKKMEAFLEKELPADVRLQKTLYRDDNKQALTLLRLSPHYVLDNFK